MPDWCKRCGAKDELTPYGWCEGCFAEMAEDFLDPRELKYVQHQTSWYVTDLTRQAWKLLKPTSPRFNYVMRPFSRDSLETLRRYILFNHAEVSISEIGQTKGARGGRVKEWKMELKETAGFQAFLVMGWPAQDRTSFGTAKAITDGMVTAWVPPLSVVLRASDQHGELDTICTWTMSRGTMTEHGCSFSPGFDYAPTNLAIQRRYLSVHVARIQQWRLKERNRLQLQVGGAVPIGGALPSLLSHGLFTRAARHL